MCKISLYLFPLLLFLGAAPAIKTFRISGKAQGTSYHITYYAKDSIISKTDIENLLKELDNSLSIYQPNSLISQFNNSAKGLKVDRHLRKVVQESLSVYKETNGIFDITSYPILAAWGFGTEKVVGFPDSARIDNLMLCVGSDKILLQNDFLEKTVPCIKLDVNGIAQGYSVDVLANFLDSKKIDCYMVEIGGELKVKGKKPDGTYMKVGIEGPATDNRDEPFVRRIVTLKKGAITTAGNYRKYIEKENKRISHLIDARTGHPIENEMISVTVVAKNAITADGYDTPLMGMNLKEALVFMRKHPDMQAYFIYRKSNGAMADTATVGFYSLIDSDKSGQAGPD
ncbi:FAD:protein FMN transferase [Pedobacter nanyangensis]|uniref:FAD:protein FMN transferase n=1 Tax=Pedobacter nanyangensis TaxID=1562389 RepID=UPI000DE24EF9|nr:FAD:protein FMN transferase [Pedobacter nanyangensis]